MAIGIPFAVVVLLIVFYAGRYGWRLAGFSACEGAGIERVEVSEQNVTITGFNPSSFPEGFIGYVSEESEGTLYVGFRFSRIFGFFEPGDFTVTIPVKEEIRQVIIRAGTSEYPVWSEPEAGDLAPEDLVWHEDLDYYSRRAMNVSNLRRKLKITPDTPDYIRSVHNIDYKFNPDIEFL